MRHRFIHQMSSLGRGKSKKRLLTQVLYAPLPVCLNYLLISKGIQEQHTSRQIKEAKGRVKGKGSQQWTPAILRPHPRMSSKTWAKEQTNYFCKQNRLNGMEATRFMLLYQTCFARVNFWR